MIMVKNRSSGTRNWAVYHKDLTGTNKYLRLNTSDVEQTDSSTWNNTAPTSSVWSVAASGETNQNTENFVFYAFHSVKGYSKFGSYTGNGNADGPFVYTGFKPAMVILKRIDGSANWQLNDSARDTFNVVYKRLAPSTSDAEATNFNFGDFLSNGFKIRQTDQTWNTSGANYIYMAFAERSLVGTNNIPALAR